MKKWSVITCASFTAVLLLFTLLAPLGVTPAVTGEVVHQVFLMSLTIGVLMLLWDKISNQFDSINFWLDNLIRVVVCYLVVFFEGCAVGMLSFTWFSLWEITLVLLPTYLFTYAVGYLTLSSYANLINDKIQKRHKRKF